MEQDWFEDPKKLLDNFNRRYNNAKSIADQWASILEACFHYAIPNRNRFWRAKGEQGEQKNKRIYDTTAVEATKTFVSKLHVSMTPPQTQWGFLEIADDYDGDDETAKEDAQRVLDRYMQRLFKYIHGSNFDTVINECYFDQAIGTSCLVVNQHTDKDPLLFTSIPLDKLAIEESIDGTVKTWFRTWNDIRINEITSKWRNAVLTHDLLQQMHDNPEAKVSRLKEGVIHIPGAKKPFCYLVCVDEDILSAEFLESNPGIVWRFQKINAETWGRGPLMDALPSIASLNEMARIELASANLNTFRPYMGWSDSIFNPHTFRLEPFTVIPIAPLAAGATPPLVPLPDSSNPSFGQLTIQDLRNQVRTLMFNDSSTTPSIQPQSATEVMMNQQDLAEKIGPLFSRLQQEFLWPVVERCSYILDKMGVLKRPKVDGKIIQFAYRSPLAGAQGQRELAKFAQYVQMLQQMFGPEIVPLYVNPKVAPFMLAEYLQVDPQLLNSPTSVERESQKLAEQHQEMNQMAQVAAQNNKPQQ